MLLEKHRPKQLKELDFHLFTARAEVVTLSPEPIPGASRSLYDFAMEHAAPAAGLSADPVAHRAYSHATAYRSDPAFDDHYDSAVRTSHIRYAFVPAHELAVESAPA